MNVENDSSRSESIALGVDAPSYTIYDLERFAQDFGLTFGITWSEAERTYYGYVEEAYVVCREFKRISDFSYLVNAMVEYAKSCCDLKEDQA